jgi:hypothetical protein
MYTALPVPVRFDLHVFFKEPGPTVLFKVRYTVRLRYLAVFCYSCFLETILNIGEECKYNLGDVQLYPRTIQDDRVVHDPFRGLHHTQPYVPSNKLKSMQKELLVRVPLPARSLLILYGAARYPWID